MSQAAVMIHKMQLTGDVSQKNAFLDSLDNQGWFEDSQKIIFIRKIKVQGRWWELADKIVQQANQYRSSANNDDQLVFLNYAQMAAEFIRNLLSGYKPWYLESWLQQEQLPPEPAAIVVHKLNDIPSILNQLQENKSDANKCLSDLFFSFNMKDLQKLKSALITLSPVLNRLQDLSMDDENLQLGKLSFPQSARQWINEYFEAMVQPKYSKKEMEIILSIISCLSAWRFAPQLLNDLNGFKIWHAYVNKLYREEFHSDLTLPLARGGNKLPLSEGEISKGEQEKTNLPLAGSTNNPSPLPKERLGGGENLPQFLIHQTGILFLINLLKTNPTLTLPFESGGGKKSEQLNPWVTLHQVFQRIAEAFSFPIESSLQSCLIEISALTEEEFYEQSTFHNPIVENVYEQLKQKLQRMNLWNPDWFFIPARFEIDQAYVHGYLDNSAVQLDIRHAGLDVNPGWVPWLGRVIYFHYGQYPELKFPGAKP